MIVNWQDLENQILSSSDELNVSPDCVTRALEVLLGDDFLKSAVQQCIKGLPQAELARQILVRVRSSVAMDFCYRIYQESSDFNERIEALGLLRWIANKSIIKWIPEFLNHADKDVRSCGVAIVDQMLFKKIIYYEDIEEILSSTLNHTKDKYVQERIQAFIEAEELV